MLGCTHVSHKASYFTVVIDEGLHHREITFKIICWFWLPNLKHSGFGFFKVFPMNSPSYAKI